MNYKLFYVVASIFILWGCGQSNNEKTGNPGPITESDKSRYNLNSADEIKYGTIDSIKMDSIRKDSMERNSQP